MSKRFYIALIFLGGLLLFSPYAHAAQKKKGKDPVVWNKVYGSKTGLYTTKNYFISHGVGLTASALYYFGDVDNEGVAFKGGFNTKNLSLGGGFTFFYNLPAGNHCNLRFSLMAGSLGGNNELKFNSLAEPRDDYRSFKAILVQPALGVQYYPFIQSGFYLYGGISLSGSIIQNYKFYYYDNADNSSKKERQVVEGSTYGILPMVQLGLGWSWKLAPNWSLSAEIMIQEGIVDTHYMNLDAWPLDKSQNGKGLELGNSWGKWTDRYGKEHIHWNDGWFQVGLTITYHWRNCEYCRILNNYNNIRPHRQYR